MCAQEEEEEEGREEVPFGGFESRKERGRSHNNSFTAPKFPLLRGRYWRLKARFQPPKKILRFENA